MADRDLRDEDYRTLADFRYQLRRFLRFSENAAKARGLTPQQYQALLAIRAVPDGEMTVGLLAERLLVRAHSATELIDRLERQGLASRHAAPEDGRQVRVRLTPDASQLLASLAGSHRDEIHRLAPLLRDLLDRL